MKFVEQMQHLQISHKQFLINPDNHTESMRIQPTFFGIQKLCTKAYTMPLLPGQKEPVTIPAGTPVLVPFATVQQ